MCYDVLTTSSEDDGVKERSDRVQKMPGRGRGEGERERESSSGNHIGVKVFVEQPWGPIGNNERKCQGVLMRRMLAELLHKVCSCTL
jgi:hypothetical protein